MSGGSALTLLLDRGPAAQLRALHDQLAGEGHEFLHAVSTKHRLSLFLCPRSVAPQGCGARGSPDPRGPSSPPTVPVAEVGLVLGFLRALRPAQPQPFCSKHRCLAKRCHDTAAVGVCRFAVHNPPSSARVGRAAPAPPFPTLIWPKERLSLRRFYFKAFSLYRCNRRTRRGQGWELERCV